MTEATRRGFIAMAGAGTAAAVVVAVAPKLSASSSTEEDTSIPAAAQGAMAAYIHDVHKGEVSLMVGGREVIVTDKTLTARLARAFSQATQG
jgi:hypothetical protein